MSTTQYTTCTTRTGTEIHLSMRRGMPTTNCGARVAQNLADVTAAEAYDLVTCERCRPGAPKAETPPAPPVVIPASALVGMSVSATTISGRPVLGPVEEIIETTAGPDRVRITGHADVLISSIDALWIVGSERGTVKSVPAIVVAS